MNEENAEKIIQQFSSVTCAGENCNLVTASLMKVDSLEHKPGQTSRNSLLAELQSNNESSFLIRNQVSWDSL